MRGFAAGAFCQVPRAAPYSFGSRATSIWVSAVSPHRGSVCMEHRENPSRTGGMCGCTQQGLPSRRGLWKVPRAMSSTAGKAYPRSPAPIYWKVSDLCCCDNDLPWESCAGILPAGHFHRGRFNSPLLETPVAAGIEQHKAGCLGTVVLSHSGREGFVRLRPL